MTLLNATEMDTKNGADRGNGRWEVFCHVHFPTMKNSEQHWTTASVDGHQALANTSRTGAFPDTVMVPGTSTWPLL